MTSEQSVRRLSYLGPAGTFTEQAADSWTGCEKDTELMPLPTVADVVAALREGTADAAVVPFENSVEGSVPTTMQALLEAPEVRIVDEVLVEVQFDLLVRPGTGRQAITTVATHPHAAAQVRARLERELRTARVVPESSTAAAAEAVAHGRYDAAVAAPRAAATYGLEAAVQGIADRPGAQTRFVVLGGGQGPGTHAALPAPTGADRTTLVVLIWQNQPGALHHLLGQFASRGIDLTRLESRPTGAGLGEYCFWIDADAHLQEPRMQEALVGLRRTCREVRFLGSYPRADRRAHHVPDNASRASYEDARTWLESLLSGPAGATGPSRR